MLKFETTSLLTSEYEPPEIKSNGEGEMEIWKVEGTNRVAIRTDRYGIFFASNTYHYFKEIIFILDVSFYDHEQIHHYPHLLPPWCHPTHGRSVARCDM